LHRCRAADRDRNTDDNGIHLLAAPLKTGVQGTRDRRQHNVVYRGAVAVRDGPDIVDPRPSDCNAALFSGRR
jgi:hypothetical protein